MAGGKNNTQRIEILESQAATFTSRLDVHDSQIEGLTEALTKSRDTTEGHTAKITVVEQQLLLLVDLKAAMAAVASIEKEFVAIKKDVENLGKWKEELKKERDEASRRWWAFGPNIMAALIGAFFVLLNIAVSIGLFLLNKWWK
jgi:hypothetical protein